LLLNDTSVSVVFPTRRLSEFPHAEYAIVLGCQRQGYVEAHWIAFPELDTIYASEGAAEPCTP